MCSQRAASRSCCCCTGTCAYVANAVRGNAEICVILATGSPSIPRVDCASRADKRLTRPLASRAFRPSPSCVQKFCLIRTCAATVCAASASPDHRRIRRNRSGPCRAIRRVPDLDSPIPRRPTRLRAKAAHRAVAVLAEAEAAARLEAVRVKGKEKDRPIEAPQGFYRRPPPCCCSQRIWNTSYAA